MQPPIPPPGFAYSQPQAPGTYNPQISAPPQAYTPGPPTKPYQAAPQTSPYQNLVPPQTKNRLLKGNPFQNLKHKVSGFGAGPFIAVLFVTILISTSSTYFAMGGTMFSNSNPDEFTGKWYSANNEHFYLADDGEIQLWYPPRFVCISGDQTISGSYVNDGDEDCYDGSDEGTNRANSFNPSLKWVGIGDILNSYRVAPDNHASGGWEVLDGELCLQYEYGSDPQGVFSVQNCLKAEVVGKALWILEGGYWLNEGGLPDREEGEERCKVWLDLGRANGPQNEDEQWVNTWNFALEDAYGSRPSFCQNTPFDYLKYDDDDYYDYYY